MNKIGVLVEEIEATLNEYIQDQIYNDPKIEGWVEALEYVLKQIEVIVE